MDKDDLKKLAGDPRFISGVYNYCDRWCERCHLTSRCLNYAIGEEQFPDPESRDLNNKAFWEGLAATLGNALELLQEMADERGIDLDALDLEERQAIEERERLERELAVNHECSRAARAYWEMVDDWFDAVQELHSDSAEMQLRPDPGDASLPEGEAIADAVEVVRWYQHQIHVKILRAIRGMIADQPEGLEDFPSDSDGSAKVALIGMDRSLAAWEEIRQYFPEVREETVRLMVHLERLRRRVEHAFPKARAFIRPGFDRVDLNS